MTRWFSWIAPLLLACVSSCSSYEVAWQSARLRYDAAEDTLHVLEQQHGVTHGTKSVASASMALQEAVEGRRRFPAEGGFLCLDLDRDDLENWDEEERTAFRSFAAHVQVVDARVVRAEDGTLGFIRHGTITDLTHALPLVNDWMNRQPRESAAPQGEFVPEFPVFDLETKTLFARAFETGHAWFSVRDGAIELDLPMTETNAGRCLAAMVRGGGQDYTGAFEALSSVHVSDGHARLRFCAPPRSIVTFETEPKPCEADAELVQALEAAGVSIRDEATARALVRRFEGPFADAPAPGSQK